MILNTRREALRKPRLLPDLLRRTLRLVCMLGSVAVFIVARAAGAAEPQILYISCGGDSFAQLVPAGSNRTNAVDMTGRRPVTFETFDWACTFHDAKFRFSQIRAALRRQEIDAGCDENLRISTNRSSEGIATPEPASSSELPTVAIPELDVSTRRTPAPPVILDSTPARTAPQEQYIEHSPERPATVATAETPARSQPVERREVPSRDGSGGFGLGVIVVLGAIAALVALSAVIGRARDAARVAKERRRLGRVQNIEAFVDEKMREISHAKRQLEREMRDLANDQR